MTSGQPINTHIQSEFGQWLSWLGREAGVTAFGFLLFAIFFAAIGYLVSSFGWRWWIARKRERAADSNHRWRDGRWRVRHSPRPDC